MEIDPWFFFVVLFVRHSVSLFVKLQATRNFSADQWNRLGAAGMNVISFTFFLSNWFFLSFISKFHTTLSTLWFSTFLSIFWNFCCFCCCRANLTMKFNQMTTFYSYQHCMEDNFELCLHFYDKWKKEREKERKNRLNKVAFCKLKIVFYFLKSWCCSGKFFNYLSSPALFFWIK